MQHPAPRALFGWTALALAVLAPAPARAQVIAAAFQPYYPERLVNGTSSPPRPVNLNPNGVNRDDCVRDMTLRFHLTLSGFANQSVELWATRSGDCTSQAARGIGPAPTCWRVGQGGQPINATSPVAVSYDVRVQDLVGPQNLANPDGSMPLTNAYHRWGSQGCSQQPSFAAVPISLWVLPVDVAGVAVGTAYSQQISTDTVGPPAPTGVGKAAGDTLLTVTWVANSDLDTVGYDVFIDPPPGAPPIDAAAEAQLYCPGSGASSGSTSGSTSGAATGSTSGAATGSTSGAATGSTSDAATDSTSDAATDSTSDAATDSTSGASGSTSGAASGSASGGVLGSGSTAGTASSGCINVNFGPPITGACGSAVLTGGTVLDASMTTTQPVLDQDGNTIEGGSATTTGGGVSTIPCAYGIHLGSNCYSGGDVTITGEPSSSYTIPGLTNGVWYNVVVAAVDGSGNVGPPSPEVCDYPAPVSDFWKTYRNAGGQAGGGFCALETLGAPAGASFALGVAGAGLLAAVRRRRRVK
jgi:hypothetical protein